MYLYIEIAEVVANAFIDLLVNQKKRTILYRELDKYGARVVEILNREKDTNAVYIVSKESQQAICQDYSDYYEEYTDADGAKGIRLLEGVDENVLWDAFCTPLSLKVIKAFITVRTSGKQAVV